MAREYSSGTLALITVAAARICVGVAMILVPRRFFKHASGTETLLMRTVGIPGWSRAQQLAAAGHRGRSCGPQHVVGAEGEQVARVARVAFAVPVGQLVPVQGHGQQAARRGRDLLLADPFGRTCAAELFRVKYVTVTTMGGYRRRHGQWSPAGHPAKYWLEADVTRCRRAVWRRAGRRYDS